MPTRRHVRIALIDDDPLEYPLVARSLQTAGPDEPTIELVAFASVTLAIDDLLADPPDLILLDYRLPPSYDYAASLMALRDQGCRSPVAVISNCVPPGTSHADVVAFIDKHDVTPARLAPLLSSHAGASAPYEGTTARLGNAAAASQKQEIA